MSFYISIFSKKKRRTISKWRKIKHISMWLWLVTLMLVNQQPLDIWFTCVEESKKEHYKNYNNRQIMLTKVHSNMLGSWIVWKLQGKEVSLLIFLYGNSRLGKIMLLSSTPQDTEISSKTWSQELLKLTVLS